jgi:hypothetical protein
MKSRKTEIIVTTLVKSVRYLVANDRTKPSVVQCPANRRLMKNTVFWDVIPCGLVEIYQRFRVTCCLYHLGTRGFSWYLPTRLTASHPGKE